MHLLKGFVLVRKVGPGKAFIFGRPQKVIEHSPLEFAPFDTLSEALISLRNRTEQGQWRQEEKFLRLFVSHLNIQIAQAPSEERELFSGGPYVVFSKGRHDQSRNWSMAGVDDLPFLF